MSRRRMQPKSLRVRQLMSIDRGGQEHSGVSGTLAPGEIRDFPYTGSGFIWNNNERDPGALYDAAGRLISYWPDE